MSAISKRTGSVVALLGAIVLLSSFSKVSLNELAGTSERDLTSGSFPDISATSDQDDILSTYPLYLKFALAIGKEVDNATARKLSANYSALRKRSPQFAARFLKGLRFEMEQKLELMGASPASITTHSPEMRRWVAKYMKEWNREADEHLFRAITMKVRE